MRGESVGCAGQDLVVTDAERLDPPLLPKRQPDEEAELDQLSIAKMRMQLVPQCIIGDRGIPDDRTRVGERSLLTRAELIGIAEVQ
jgi:hypothetical protein